MPESGQVITAMVTPFDENGEISEPGIQRVVDHLFDNGSDGLVVCGTTGESPTLSHDEKLQMFRSVKQAARGRGPIIAGTGTYNTAESIELTRHAEEIGVDGILAVTPYYNKPSQEGLYRHFRAIANSVQIPVIIYNVPPRTSINIEASTVIRLANDVSNIVGVKEASGNLVQVSEIVAGSPDGFKVYSGDDGIVLPVLSVGGVGVVSVTSHVAGKQLKRMHEAYFAGDYREAAKLHSFMLPVVKACFQSTTPSPAPVKAALNFMGLNVGSLRLPLVEVNDVEREIVRKALAAYAT